MTAPVGATVRIYVDLVERVEVDHVIQTTSGRRYRVIGVRVQQRGKHAGRQHLQCLVIERSMLVGEWIETTIHHIRWYPRGAERRRRAA